jgi:hypothetical protein
MCLWARAVDQARGVQRVSAISASQGDPQARATGERFDRVKVGADNLELPARHRDIDALVHQRGEAVPMSFPERPQVTKESATLRQWELLP